jgi:hypothetical protein
VLSGYLNCQRTGPSSSLQLFQNPTTIGSGSFEKNSESKQTPSLTTLELIVFMNESTKNRWSFELIVSIYFKFFENHGHRSEPGL